ARSRAGCGCRAVAGRSCRRRRTGWRLMLAVKLWVGITAGDQAHDVRSMTVSTACTGKRTNRWSRVRTFRTPKPQQLAAGTTREDQAGEGGYNLFGPYAGMRQRRRRRKRELLFFTKASGKSASRRQGMLQTRLIRFRL